MLPFTPAQFFEVFAAYNSAIWPAQVAAYLLGIAIVAPLIWPCRFPARLSLSGLALMWAFTGFVYHLNFFAEINRLAPVFGAIFVVQGALLLSAATGNGWSFHPEPGFRGWLGVALIFYAAVAYPLLGMALGHAYPRLPMFGVTPCPLTIFTLGLFLLGGGAGWWLWVIPVLWSLVGGTAAFLLDVPQDWLLLASGPLTLAVLLRPSRGAATKG